jgi:MYXO-CTERM domain-containing protein
MSFPVLCVVSRLRVALPVAVALAGAPAASGALVFTSGPSEFGLGSFDGEMSFVATDATSGLLTVTLTNTSPASNEGWLTAFAFNVVDGVALAFSSGPANWSGLVNPSGSPYGTFDYGASTSASWEGGGNPSVGIAIGQTASVSFLVTASAPVLAGLTDESFFDASNGYAFVARFRGFADGNSDKVVGVVPGPGALALAAVGALASRRRRR